MMGAYKLSLHGSLPSDGSRGSSNDGNRSSSVGKQKDSHKGGHRHKFFQSTQVQDLQSPPRRSTACCDGLSARRDFERRLSTIVPLQNFHCVGHSFRSEDSESLALWEEKEQPASNNHGWLKLTRSSSRWLEAMRKFDTMKLAPWRSSPVHPKTSLDGQRLSLSDRKGSMKSFHGSAKSPWYSSATKKIGIGESRSVRNPVGASNLSRQSGELIPASGDLLMSCTRSGHLNRLVCSKHGNSSRKRDTQSITEESPRLPSPRDMSSKPEFFVKKECLVNDATLGIPVEGRNVVQIEGAREEVTKNAIPPQLKTTTTNTGASRNSTVKAMDTLTPEFDILSDMISAVQEKEDEESALAPVKGEATVPFNRREKEATVKFETLATEATCRKDPRHCSRLVMPPSEQDDDTSPYEALRQSEPSNGNLYVIQSRTPNAASRVQSVISKGEEADMCSQSCILKSRSSIDADEGHFSRMETWSTPDRLFTSLREKGFRSTRLDSGRQRNLEDIWESSSSRSIICGLTDEGSLPPSNPSLRSGPEMLAFSALPTCALQSKSRSGASFDQSDFEVTRSEYSLNTPKSGESRRASLSFRDLGPSRPLPEDATSKLDAAAAVKETQNPKLLGCEDNSEARSSPQRTLIPELWTAIFPSNDQESPEQPDSPCAATECKSAFTVCSTPPVRRLSYVSPSELEDRQMSSIVPKSRPRHDDVTARLELLTLELKERKSKSKSLFNNRRHSSADSSDAPTMMISINKAMKKILLKCTVKRTNMKGNSKMESPVPDTLRPADFQVTEAN